MLIIHNFDIDFNSFFTFNQIFNIFYLFILKFYILYFQFLTSLATIISTSLLPSLFFFYYFEYNLFLYQLKYNFLYICTKFIFEKKVLYILLSQGQATYLMSGLQEKTTYRLVLFPSNSSRTKDILQKKTTKRTISKVVRETTD